jgi:hypothetical protein
VTNNKGSITAGRQRLKTFMLIPSHPGLLFLEDVTILVISFIIAGSIIIEFGVFV